MVLRLATLSLILGLTASTFAVGYSSPDGDPFYADNYALDEEFYQVAILSDVKDIIPIPEPVNTAPCTAMNYNDYVDGGYGMN